MTSEVSEVNYLDLFYICVLIIFCFSLYPIIMLSLSSKLSSTVLSSLLPLSTREQQEHHVLQAEMFDEKSMHYKTNMYGTSRPTLNGLKPTPSFLLKASGCYCVLMILLVTQLVISLYALDFSKLLHPDF